MASITVTHVCAGDSGAVARITLRGTRLVERHLASASVASTHGVSGVTAVGFSRRRLAVLFDDGGVGPTGVSGIASPFGRAFGKLDFAPRATGGPLHAHADLAAFAATHPQAPAALGPGSPATPIRAQAVPSSVAVGPGGALYVGLLIGIPSLPGTAAVERVAPGHAPTVAVAGLTRVSDLAFDGRGRLDILESNLTGGPVPGTGALLRATLRPGRPVHARDLDVPGLQAPVGLAVARRTGVAYITDDTSVPGGAEVVAIHGLGDAR